MAGRANPPIYGSTCNISNALRVGHVFGHMSGSVRHRLHSLLESSMPKLYLASTHAWPHTGIQ